MHGHPPEVRVWGLETRCDIPAEAWAGSRPGRVRGSMVTGDRSWRQWTVGGAPACPEFAAHSDDLKSARSQLGGGLTLHPPPSLRGESPPTAPGVFHGWAQEDQRKVRVSLGWAMGSLCAQVQGARRGRAFGPLDQAIPAGLPSPLSHLGVQFPSLLDSVLLGPAHVLVFLTSLGGSVLPPCHSSRCPFRSLRVLDQVITGSLHTSLHSLISAIFLCH
jgi:hypothetical protein